MCAQGDGARFEEVILQINLDGGLRVSTIRTQDGAAVKVERQIVKDSHDFEPVCRFDMSRRQTTYVIAGLRAAIMPV